MKKIFNRYVPGTAIVPARTVANDAPAVSFTDEPAFFKQGPKIQATGLH